MRNRETEKDRQIEKGREKSLMELPKKAPCRFMR